MVMRMRKASRFLGVFFLEALSSWSLDRKIFSTNQQESPGFRLEPSTGGGAPGCWVTGTPDSAKRGVLSHGVYAAGADQRHCLPEQGGDLRHPVEGVEAIPTQLRWPWIASLRSQ
jgi:hypothetical protein